MRQEQAPVWFITGCSRGFGKELAKLTIGRGWKTVVTARKVDELDELAKNNEESVLALSLDVTDPAAREKAVKAAQQKFGKIDVLVNNAGYGYLSAVEEGEEEQVRKLFETNFFGLVALTNLVLPGMRERKSGTIVNFSSIGGLVSFPGIGYYHATKYAVEGISDSLSQEVKPLGIHVIIVEPGPFRTDWAGSSIAESKQPIVDYEGTAGAQKKKTQDASGKQAGDPVRAGEAVIKAVESSDPPLHLVLGKPALDTAYKKLETLRQDFDAWKDVSLSADFPDAQKSA